MVHKLMCLCVHHCVIVPYQIWKVKQIKNAGQFLPKWESLAQSRTVGQSGIWMLCVHLVSASHLDGKNQQAKDE